MKEEKNAQVDKWEYKMRSHEQEEEEWRILRESKGVETWKVLTKAIKM